MKKTVKTVVEHWYDFDEKTADQVIDMLNEYKEKFPGQTLKFEEDWAGDSIHYHLVAQRQETDEEVENRKKMEKIQEEEQRKKDLKEFDRLKEKLGL